MGVTPGPPPIFFFTDIWDPIPVSNIFAVQPPCEWSLTPPGEQSLQPFLIADIVSVNLVHRRRTLFSHFLPSIGDHYECKEI